MKHEAVSVDAQVEAIPCDPVVPKPAAIALGQFALGAINTPDGTVLTMSPKAYEVLSANVAEMRRWIVEAYAQLDYYQEALQRCGSSGQK